MSHDFLSERFDQVRHVTRLPGVVLR